MSRPPGRSQDEDGPGLFDADFTRAYTDHAQAVYGTAYIAARDRQAAWDATQDAFEEALRQWSRLRYADHAKLRAWLCWRAKMRVIDSWRKTRAEYPDDDLPDQPDPRCGEDTAAAVIDVGLFWEKISTAVSPRAFRAAYLAWNEGWTVTEIADHLGASRRTINRELDAVLAEARKPGNATSLEGGQAQ